MNQVEPAKAQGAHHPAPPSAVQAVFIVGALFPLVGSYLGLSVLFGIQAGFMGFLFATYWGAVKGMALIEFMPSLAGALTGLVLAAMLAKLPIALGVSGLVLALAVTYGMLFLIVRQRLPLLLNPSMMIYLTVGSIPALNVADNIAELLIGTLSGAIYVGGLALLGSTLARRRQEDFVPAAPDE